MAARKSLGRGLEDRTDSSAIRARVRRSDREGNRHSLNQQFPYDPLVPAESPYSRTSAVTRARAWLAEQQRSLRLDGARQGSRLEDQTLGGWVQRYIEEARAGALAIKHGETRKVPLHARKKWIEKDLYLAKCWLVECPGLMAKSPDQVTASDLNHEIDFFRYRRMDEDGNLRILKPSTIIRRLMLLSSVYRAAAREWKFEIANPVLLAQRPQPNAPHEHEREGRLVSDDELSKILAALSDASPETLACLRFLRWSGARRSEALKLVWADVDLASEIPTATFRDTKDPRGRKRHRTIPLAQGAVDALRELMGERSQPKSGRVFPISEDTPTRAWGRGRMRAGLNDVRLHDLRHTRSTEVTADLDIMEAKAITGHKDARMLDRYYHPDAQKLGKKLLAAEAKRNEEARVKHTKSDQLTTPSIATGKPLTASQRKKAALAVQLLEEAGLPVPADLHQG